MRNLQKIILPLIFLISAFIIYSMYFHKDNSLGKFSSFDPNNNANKDIRITIIREKGVKIDEAAGSVMFFGRDKDGVEYPVQAPLPVPEKFNEMQSVMLKGHLHKDHFHAVEFVQ